MHNYWIGDRVWIASENAEGIFEGEQDLKAIVKVQGQKKLVAFDDISLLPEDDDDFIEFHDNSDKPASIPFEVWDNTLDLHIEELNPALIHSESSQILAHQLSRLKAFLSKAIDRRTLEVTIIHGKGEGVLRSEVLRILDTVPQVKRVEDDRSGGAVVVMFIV
jgi:dsDNA-specific endonuclease/ATPase MutS2